MAVISFIGMLSEFISYLWIAIGVSAGIVEILTLSSVALWFIPSAAAAFSLSLSGTSAYIQTACFIIISLIGIVLSRIILRNRRNSNKVGTVKRLMGKTAIVTEDIDNENDRGSVRINGTIWSARTEDGDLPYESGMIVTVVGIDTDGKFLICAR